MQERKTTMGEYRWNKDPEGGGHYSADDPMEPEGEGWRMEGSGMSDGAFAWFWVRDVRQEGGA
jgi:hypothetical protein